MNPLTRQKFYLVCVALEDLLGFRRCVQVEVFRGVRGDQGNLNGRRIGRRREPPRTKGEHTHNKSDTADQERKLRRARSGDEQRGNRGGKQKNRETDAPNARNRSNPQNREEIHLRIADVEKRTVNGEHSDRKFNACPESGKH